MSAAEAAYVDAEVAESADGRIPWTRFEALVVGKVAAAAPALAREKELKARRARFAKKVGKPEHGMASFMIRADVGTIDTIESAVAGAADRLAEVFRDDPTPEATEPGETALSVDDRRVLGLLRLVHPGSQPDSGPHVDLSDLRPQVTLYLHLDGRQDAEVDEHGRADRADRAARGPRPGHLVVDP